MSFKTRAQSREQKQQQCKELLLEEFKNVLSKDNGLIQAQLSLTSMKLAKKILERKGLSSQTMESYLDNIVGEKTINRLNGEKKIQEDILGLYNKYSGSKKFLSVEGRLDELKNLEHLSDQNISEYMIQMQTIWKEKDDFGFNEKDFATAWFVNQAQQNTNGKDSYFVSNSIKTILKDSEKSENDYIKAHNIIAENLKTATLHLKGELQKLKSDVFKKHKEICLDFYANGINPESQNVSIFENISCRPDDEDILEGLFVKSLEDILGGMENIGYTTSGLRYVVPKEYSPKEIRQKQDYINSLPNNKDRVVEYYKQHLGPTSCDGFIIVDKKKMSSTLYLNDGSEVMTSNTIIGDGVFSNNQQFNPDSILRKWVNNGKTTYSKTTGAGIFYVDKSISEIERSNRAYDKEFNNRVMVLYSKKENDEKREEIQAIHAVPNEAWVKNKQSRMNSFESENAERRLSTGCVNLEGYTYDIMNNFVGNNCPIYILPEDPDNYLVAHNGELVFSSSIDERRKGHEKADANNENKYNFSPLNKEIKTVGYENSKLKSQVLDKLFEQKSELIRRAVQMEEDDFQDLLALTHAVTNNPDEAVNTFIDLYNSAYRVKSKGSKQTVAQYDSAPMLLKRKMILESYQNEFSKTVNLKELVELSKEVEFVY